MRTLLEYLDTKIKNDKFLAEQEPDNPKTWKVGDIVYGLWGYTISRPHFYKIDRITPNTLFLTRLKGKIVEGAYNGQYKEIPTDQINKDYPQARATIRKKSGRAVITKENYMHLYLWTGEPVYGDGLD